jgi:hypothetical protein
VHDLQRELLPQRAARLAPQQRTQPARRLGAAVLQRLAHRAESEQHRGLDVIEADHGQLAGDPPAGPVGRGEDPHRLRIRRREDRRGRVGQREQLGGERLGVRRPMRPAPHQAGVVLEAGVLQRLLVSAQPLLRRREAQVGARGQVPGVADKADPPVPERQQVLGRHPAARDVIGDRVRDAGERRIDGHQRHPGPAERGQPLPGQPERDDDHAVHPVPAGQRREVMVALPRGVDVAHHGVVTLLIEDCQGAGQPHHR